MALDTDNVRVGLDGRIYVAPKGTTAPTDLTSPWAAGWVDLGLMSPDGVEMTYATETEDVDAWQSLSPVRKILTGVDMSLAFTAIECKRDVITLYFPESSIGTAGGVHTLSIKSAPESDERAFGFEWTDSGITNRIVLARGEVTERGSITTSRGGAVSMQMTVSAYATSSDDIATWLSDDPAWAAA